MSENCKGWATFRPGLAQGLKQCHQGECVLAWLSSPSWVVLILSLSPQCHQGLQQLWHACACKCAKSLQLCLTLCDPMDSTRLLCPWNFPGKNTGVVAMPDPGMEPVSLPSPAPAGGFFTAEILGKPAAALDLKLTQLHNRWRDLFLRNPFRSHCLSLALVGGLVLHQRRCCT